MVINLVQFPLQQENMPELMICRHQENNQCHEAALPVEKLDGTGAATLGISLHPATDTGLKGSFPQ